jgi:hypothetical protein
MQTSSGLEAEKLREQCDQHSANALPGQVREILLAQPLNPLRKLAFSPVPRVAAVPRRVAQEPVMV